MEKILLDTEIPRLLKKPVIMGGRFGNKITVSVDRDRFYKEYFSVTDRHKRVELIRF